MPIICRVLNETVSVFYLRVHFFSIQSLFSKFQVVEDNRFSKLATLKEVISKITGNAILETPKPHKLSHLTQLPRV